MGVGGAASGWMGQWQDQAERHWYSASSAQSYLASQRRALRQTWEPTVIRRRLEGCAYLIIPRHVKVICRNY